jgi:hypothetical protein
MGKRIEVGNEEHLEAAVEQGGHNLPRDFRSLTFVGRGKRFVEEDLYKKIFGADAESQQSPPRLREIA